ncbi:MAG: FAD-dependent oxidoreductase [Bacillus sp. (in: Bacteria)]|nr:FAD-dependent oxidoreductase [Bacillus sp. (in: firmicutes)]
MSKNEIPNKPKSLWRDVEVDSFPPLSENIETDVTVIGAGITGVTSAYLLMKKGYNVVLLEAGRIVEGTTGHTTAKVTSQHALIYAELIKNLGKEKAKLYYEANQEALRMIDEIRKEHDIECDFDYETAYVYGENENDADRIEKEAKAYEELGIDGGLTEDTDLPFAYSAAIQMHNQAQFHPVKYLKGMANILQQNGVSIYEKTRAVDVKKGDRPEVVTENDHTITSDHVVIASHVPFKDLEGLYFSRLRAERSYILAAKVEKKIPKGIYINAGSPKRSIRHWKNDEGETFLIVGGEEHTAGQSRNTEEDLEKLRNFAHEHFTVKDIPFHWSSQDIFTLDRVPYVGPITKNQPNIHVATGFSKWGMTNGTNAAKLITDLISNEDNRYEDLFSPSRFKKHQDVKNFLKESANAAKQYVKGKVNKGDKEPEDLNEDEGGIVSVNGKKAGAYKDSDGNLTIVDVTCTHMGCDCEWNNSERTWDCPCHGARYKPDGEVIEGPATEPLKKLEK